MWSNSSILQLVATLKAKKRKTKVKDLNIAVEDSTATNAFLEDLVDVNNSAVRLLRPTIGHLVYVQCHFRHLHPKKKKMKRNLAQPHFLFLPKKAFNFHSFLLSREREFVFQREHRHNRTKLLHDQEARERMKLLYYSSVEGKITGNTIYFAAGFQNLRIQQGCF